jgi:pectin methylesterase-like acyl-CoA thioesterase
MSHPSANQEPATARRSRGRAILPGVMILVFVVPQLCIGISPAAAADEELPGSLRQAQRMGLNQTEPAWLGAAREAGVGALELRVPSGLMGPPPEIDIRRARTIAQARARWEWGPNARVGSIIPVLGVDGRVALYDVDVSLDGSPFVSYNQVATAWQDFIRSHAETGSTVPENAQPRHATVAVSASYDQPPVVCTHLGPSSFYASGWLAAGIAAQILRTPDPKLEATVMLTSDKRLFAFTNGSRTILVEGELPWAWGEMEPCMQRWQANRDAGLMNLRAKLADRGRSAEAVLDSLRIYFRSCSDGWLTGRFDRTDPVYIMGYQTCFRLEEPAIDVPQAALTQTMDYYDERMKLGLLTTYYMSYFNPHWVRTFCHTSDLHRQWDDYLGEYIYDPTFYYDAMRTVALTKGYVFSGGIRLVGSLFDWFVDEGMTEINTSHPFVYSQHYNLIDVYQTGTAVGYDTTPEPDEWIVHYPEFNSQVWHGAVREAVIPVFFDNLVYYNGLHEGTEAYSSADWTDPDGNHGWSCDPAGEIPAGETYTIRWDRRGVPGDHVTIQLSTDGGWGWVDLVTARPDVGWFNWVPTCNPSTECRIRIRQYDAANTLLSADGSYGNFAIVDPTCPPPTLLAPVNGANCISPASGNLDWSEVHCATVYNVRLGTSCGNGTTYQVSTEYLPYTDLQPQTTYHWQVQSVDYCGHPQVWSACSSFTTGPVPLGPPALSSPDDGATCQGVSGTLAWSPVSGATGFNVQIGSVCNDYTWSYDVTGTNCGYNYLEPGRTYYWKVRTRDGCANLGAWSSCRSFTVTPQPLAAPTLLSPPDGSMTIRTSGTLDWSDVAGAAGYRLRIGTTCGSGNVFTVDSPTSQYDYSGLANHTTYYWQVATEDNCNQWGAYSACFHFVTRDPATFTVRPDGTGTHPTIQAAINACINGDIVELTDGTFTGTGNRDITFSGKAITVRSASGNPQACIIDCQGTSGNPHRGIAFNVNETSSSILDGVSIIDGFQNLGGGLYFNGNTRPTINNCVLHLNYASTNGGGVWCGSGSAPTFNNCDIYSNVSYGGGGGIHSAGATPAFIGCRVRMNNAATDGGGLFATSSSPIIRNTVFQGNSANDDGGGAYYETNSSPSPSACAFLLNVANDGGGALYCTGPANPVISSCTFSENQAAFGGTISLMSSSNLTMDHSIVSFASSGGSIYCDGMSHATLSCCDVYGNAGGDWIGCIASQNGVNGNFGANPLYCAPAVLNYALHLDSPCAPANNPTCGTVGAYGVGCGPYEPATVTLWANGSGTYPTIQAALTDLPSGSTVILTDGTYQGSGNRDIVFNGKSITLRSQNGNPSACIIDCQGSANDPHRGFYLDYAEGPGCVIQGLTVRNGFAVDKGGGLLTEFGTAPTVRNCVFENCVSALYGGAVYTYYNAHPTFENCVFRNNAAGSYGGAVDFWTNCHPSFTGCIFQDNAAVYGGAIDIYEGSHPSFQACAIYGNGATYGGGIYCDTACTPTFTRCTMYGNEAPFGQGRQLPIEPAPTSPSGVRTPPPPLLSGSGGAIYSINSADVHLANSIIASCPTGEAVACFSSATATLTCTNVHANAGGDWIGCIAPQYGTNGNFSADPQFCDPEGHLFTLWVDSPCASANNPICGSIGAFDAACGFHHTVKANGTGEYATIQAAIDAIPAQDIIDLADGTYTGTGNRDLDFRGKKITVRSESGDPDKCIIDCQGSAATPHRGVSFFRREPAGTVLEGVTIVNGYVDIGPGVYITGAGTSPTIRNCHIHDCTAPYYGAGFWIYDGASPTLEGCTVYMNTASVGGGISIAGATATIRGSTIADNQATSLGPGIMRGEGGSVTIQNSIVAGNRGGPGVVCSGSGGIAVTCTDVYGNSGGDWVGCIASMAGQNGNIGLDPLFCDAPGHDFTLHGDSPCADDHNPACGRIGSEAPSCVATEASEAEVIPRTLFLGPSVPNPFGDGTVITYGLPSPPGDGPVRLTIHDATGRRMRTLVDRDQAPGIYRVEWDGRSDDGRDLSSGIYFARIDAGGRVEKHTLVRTH